MAEKRIHLRITALIVDVLLSLYARMFACDIHAHDSVCRNSREMTVMQESVKPYETK